MKIFGYNIERKRSTLKNTEERGMSIGPSTNLGLPYSQGITVSSDQAMKLSAVFRCVDVKSSDFAAITKDVFVLKGDRGWIKDDNHFSYSILNSQPNPSCSASVFWKTFVSMMELNGNGFAKIYRDERGSPVQLELLTGIVNMYLRDNLTVYYAISDTYSHDIEILDGDDVLHVPNFTYDGLWGISTLTHAANITNLAASSDGQAKGFFDSGANASGILSVPGRISPDNAKAMKASFAEALKYDSGTGKSGGIAVVEGGAEFKQLTINPKDAQMIETRAFNVIDVCRFFGVHPSKCFDTSSASYASAESYQLAYLTDTMTPLSKKIDTEINRKLYRPSQRDKVKVISRLRDLRTADLDSLGTYYSQMFQLGAYSPDDICREMNLPIDPNGKGNKRYVQVNLAELGKIPEPVQNKNTDVTNG